MSKGRVLSIRMRNSQLVGVIDLLFEMGIEPDFALSTNIVNLIDLILSNAYRDEKIKFYETEEEAGLILQDLVRNAGKRLVQKQSAFTGQRTTALQTRLGRATGAKRQADTTPQEVDDFAPLPTENLVSIQNLNNNSQDYVGTAFDDLDDIFEQVLIENALEEEISLRERLMLSPLTKGEVLHTPKIERTVGTIDESDKRLQDDKLYKEESEVGKKLLRIIYYNLPYSDWSSEKAWELLRTMLNNLSDTK